MEGVALPKGNQKDISRFFNPAKSFFSLGVVRVAFALASILIAGSVASILTTGDFDSDFTFSGWNNLFEYFKFPIWAAAALIPIITVLAVNHKSHQHMHSMQLAREQNNFTNYYKHLEEFLKYLQQFELLGNFSVKERRLHALLFPDLKRGSLSLNEDFLSELSGRVGGLLALSGQSTAPKTASVLDVPEIRHLKDGRLCNVEQEIEAIETLYSAVIWPLPHESSWTWIEHDSDFDLVRTHYSGRLINIYRCLSFINHAVSFDADFFSPLDALLEKFDRHIIYPD